jgi:hypothetical protein
MTFSGKALYNLIRNNWKKNPSMAVKPWQVDDYRLLSNEELFLRLKKLDINVVPDSFVLFAENCDSPEELLEYLWVKEDVDAEVQDQVYLCLFELWRRLIPDKKSLSIFCDDLDHCIERYFEDPCQADEEVLTVLHEMEDILDENIDLGAEAKVIFASVVASSAYDIERFIYDYIVDQIEADNGLCASEILDGFYEYISDVKWFDFLRARLFALSSPEEANLMLGGLLEQLEEEPDLDFLLEIASYLATSGDHELFSQAIKQGLSYVVTEEDLKDLAEIVSEYYRCLDRDEKVQEIDQFLNRPKLNLDKDRTVVKGFL